MFREKSDNRYSQLSTLKGIRAEKEMLHRKIKKLEKKLEKDWDQIEKSWRIVNKIAGLGSRLLTSFS